MKIYPIDKLSMFMSIGVFFVMNIAGCGIFGEQRINQQERAEDKTGVTMQINTELKTIVFNGVIKGNDVNVREWAGTRSKVIDSVNTGDKVAILGYLKTSSKYDWYKVKCINKAAGYVASQFVVSESNIKDIWKDSIKGPEMWLKAEKAVRFANPMIGSVKFKEDAEIFYGQKYLTFSNGTVDKKYWCFIVFNEVGEAVAIHICDYADGNENSYYLINGEQSKNISKDEYKKMLGDSFFG